MKGKKKRKKPKYTSNGFIKPDGTFVSLGPEEHESYLNYSCKACATGWVKLSESCGGTYMLFVDFDYSPSGLLTQPQIDTLFEWAKKFDQLPKYRSFIETYGRP